MVALALSACESADSAPSSSVRYQPPTLPQLQARMQLVHPVPLDAGQLEAWLPEKLAGFELREREVTPLALGPVRELSARLVGVNAEGHYLALQLRDLAADSSTYLALFRRYLEEAPPETNLPATWLADNRGFGWIWQDPHSSLSYLEAGLWDRFHLRMRSNAPEAQALFRQMVQQLDLQALGLSNEP